MSFDQKTLYELLPAIYRIRDAEQGRPLGSLVGAIADQIAVLEENLAQLYDDQFIETCAEWVVPYIGDLIGYRPLRSMKQARIPADRKRKLDQRAQVANTIAYRRRKGTAAVLEQLARDVTGWEACVVELFQRLACTQSMNHVRPGCTTADLRCWKSGEFAQSPFDASAHSIDVRRIDSRRRSRGLHNIPNVGIFLWRVQAYSILQAPVAPAPDGVPGRCFRFSPLGNDMPLYAEPQGEETITQLADYRNVPLALSRKLLLQNPDFYYGPGNSIALHTPEQDASGTKLKLIDRDRILVCDLSGWADAGRLPPDKYAIDPVRGRLSRPADDTKELLVSYHYGFSADIGGGGYDRTEDLIGAEADLKVPANYSGPREAIDALSGQDTAEQPLREALVTITDNGRYLLGGELELEDGQVIILQAATQRRPLIELEGDLVVRGEPGAELTLSGLLISGGTLRITGKLGRLRIRHCTLVPGLGLTPDGKPLKAGTPSLEVESGDTRVEIEQSIVGGLIVRQGASVTIRNSIMDATALEGVAFAGASDAEAPGGTLHAENCTIIGRVYTRLLALASNCIFLARVDSGPSVVASRQQEGCVRFSFLPSRAKVPRRYHCHSENGSSAGSLWPQFTSLHYGQPGYCQLHPSCAPDIRQGADDEAEMGVFHDLYQPQREANLRVRLEEYLRFGLEAGIFYSS